jgi:hypothetical protein
MSHPGAPKSTRTRRTYPEVRALVLKAYVPLLLVFAVASALLSSSLVVGLVVAVLLAMAIFGGLWFFRRHVWPKL